MRTMYDGVSWRDIPANAKMVALYQNGDFAVRGTDASEQFKDAVVVWIDVTGKSPQSCQVLDVESGDAAPGSAPAWIRARRAVVHTSLPAVYCDRSTLSAVYKACALDRLTPGVDYQVWVSTLDGTEYQGPGVVACQVRGGMNARYDTSVVYDDKWHPAS